VLAAVPLRQSLAAFRTTQVGGRRIARGAATLALAATVASFVPHAYLKAVADTYRSQPVRELEAALQQISTSSLAASGRIPESVDMRELDATGLLSEDTRRWLSGTRITLRSSGTYRTGAEWRRYVVAQVHRANSRWFYTSYLAESGSDSVPAQPAR
jgi:hypothetical protein